MGDLPPDESRGPTLNIVCWLGAGISTTTVLLRLYSRRYLTRNLDWSDALIVIAAILHIASTALSSVAISYGAGRHLIYIPPENITPVLYYSTILQPVGIPAFCIPKLSVVLFIVKLMGVEQKGAWLLWGSIGILFACHILSPVMLFAQCNPPDHLWHTMEPAKCLPSEVLHTITYVGGAWSAFTDLLLAVYPAVILRKVRVKRSKKIGIILIMGLGFFAMIAAIIKTTQLSNNNSPDASYDLFGLILTTYIETDIVIMAACAPTLPKLFKKLFRKDEDSKYNPTYNSRSNPRGYQAFDSENNRIVALEALPIKVDPRQ
ncbi:hypothetical protein DM02DRAFT_542184 [Periconia macrospinosa]|uniref:Rhodopsin domain-containing protein n=1 Tax=Periconia macrospinosa TaxID=97972 RepID=A0A2V1D538_9PLEO|nr:hypothetical protein DM02DRAFT_542184 [Periconia macrospinosa]